MPAQCSIDADCNSGTLKGYSCKTTAGGVHACVIVCGGADAGADAGDGGGCAAPATCMGTAIDGAHYCARAECTMDGDCGPDGKCTGGTCTCVNDNFCGGAGKCKGGACVCMGDGDCTDTVANHCDL